MKSLLDNVLLEFDVKFVRPMYKHSLQSRDADYNAFRDSLFDTDNVCIYLARVVRPLRLGPLHVDVGTTLVMRSTAAKTWELEVCKPSTFNTVILQVSYSALQSMCNALQFRREDFENQPNPFGSIQFF